MEDARDRILARRARFVALALAAVGCHEGEGTKAPETVTLPPPPEDAGTHVATVEDASPPPKAEPDAGTPAGISPATAARYARARTRIAEAKEAIETVHEKIVKQAAYSSANATQWRDLVAEAQELYSTVGYLGIYCPKKSPETDAFLAWVQAEEDKLRASVDDVKRDAEKKLQDKTTTGAARWDLLWSQWNQANPRPCLSIACDSW